MHFSKERAVILTACTFYAGSALADGASGFGLVAGANRTYALMASTKIPWTTYDANTSTGIFGVPSP